MVTASQLRACFPLDRTIPGRAARQRRLIALLVVLSALALFPSSRVVAGRSYHATVQIRPYAPNGDLVTDFYVTMKLLNRPSDPPTSVHYGGPSIEKNDFSVETGDYLLTVDAPGFVRSREILRVYQPKVLRTVLLRLGYEVRSFGVSGHLQNYRGDPRRLRIRLHSLYGNVLPESALDHGGSFHLPAEWGPFLLLVLSDGPKGTVILHDRTITVEGEETLTIDLGKAVQ